MSIEKLVLALLSSSVLGGVIGAFITGRFNLSVKNREYENEYYKLVLAKRVAAYESIQTLVTGFKTAVVGEDGKAYHFILSSEEGLLTAHKLLYDISFHALWLSDELFHQTRDLSRLLFGATGHPGGAIEFGKKHYEKLAAFRAEIERLHHRDMLSLHQVPEFLISKKPQGEICEVQLGG